MAKWYLNSKLPKIRQLAAVELRKRIMQKSGVLWVNLPQDQRDQIKSHLPALIVKEQKYVLQAAGSEPGIGFELTWEIVSSCDTRLPG